MEAVPAWSGLDHRTQIPVSEAALTCIIQLHELLAFLSDHFKDFSMHKSAIEEEAYAIM